MAHSAVGLARSSQAWLQAWCDPLNLLPLGFVSINCEMRFINCVYLRFGKRIAGFLYCTLPTSAFLECLASGFSQKQCAIVDDSNCSDHSAHVVIFAK